MKKIGICVLLVCLFLTACAGSPADEENIEATESPADGGDAEITESAAAEDDVETYQTEIMLLYRFYGNWKQYYERVWLVGPAAGEQNQEEGYYVVDDAALTDLDALKAQTEAIFTAECAQEHFYTPYLEEQTVYFEQDGVLCRQYVQLPNMLTTIKDIQILEASNTEILALITQSGSGQNPEDEEFTVRIVVENGMYRIAEFSFD